MKSTTTTGALLALLSGTALAAAQPDANPLLRRTDVDPSLLCGTDYVDCNNGWCCAASQTCTSSASIPVCTASDSISPAYPFEDIEAAASSLSQVVASASATDLAALETALGAGVSSKAAALGVSLASVTASATGSATASASAAATVTGSSNSSSSYLSSNGTAAGTTAAPSNAAGVFGVSFVLLGAAMVGMFGLF